MAHGVELQVNSYTTFGQTNPAVALDDQGDFEVAWESYGRDGHNQGVVAQRFETLAPFDVDGDGSTAPLTDGLLTLRYHFGFRGATLIDGTDAPPRGPVDIVIEGNKIVAVNQAGWPGLPM